jgi:hypothetical protein
VKAIGRRVLLAIGIAWAFIRSVLGRVFGSRPAKRFLGSGIWRNHVVQSAAGTLLALTIAGLVSPSGILKDAASGVRDFVLPGPSAAQQAVDSFYGTVEGDTFWRSPPTMSPASKQLLIDHWSELSTDAPHPFSRQQALNVGLEELFQDRTLDGERIVLRGFVSQLSSVSRVQGRDDLESAAIRISIAEQDEVAWCGKVTLPRGQVPQVDQLVDVLGVVVARGAADTISGGFLNGSYLACAAVKPLVDADDAAAVASLFRGEEDNDRWMADPALSVDGRYLLMRNWDRLDPYRLHRFSLGVARTVSIDRIYEDRRLDKREFRVVGYVDQRALVPASRGRTLELIRLGVGGQRNAVWCQTTVKGGRVFGEGELVEAIGVAVARGSVEINSGGFLNGTFLACPAVRRT